MRTIKFRGKRTDTGEWAYGSLLKFDIGYVIAISETTESDDSLDEKNSIVFSADEIAGVNPDTIGQFTGLLDKNKTEVYDGDLIKAPSGRIYLVMWSTWVHQERRNKWIVDEYQFTGWCMGYERGKPIDTLDSEVLQGEVIGNEFDNLNLIQYDITEAKGNCTNK